MTTQLEVFNGALGILGEPPLTTPSAKTEAGRILRDRWRAAVDYVFEQGDWNFAELRAQLSQVSPPPAFGYQYYYGLPGDLANITFVSQSGIEGDDYLDWSEEAGKIATNASTLYIKYVSYAYKERMGAWTQSFADYVSADLAVRAAPKLNSSALPDAMKARELARKSALNVDVRRTAVKRPRPGRWATAARWGGRRSSEQGR